MSTHTLPVKTGRGTDRALARLGATVMVVGLLAQAPLGGLHPHEEYANDSPAAFHEYARSHDWVLVHLGQYVGALLVTIGLVAIAYSLVRHGGLPRALGVVGAITALVSAAVFAVQMAVDGVALKAAVDAWVAAPGPAEQDAAYRVAESVRAVEKGLSGLFNLTNGLTLVSLGLGVAWSGTHPRWLGPTGVIAGLGLLAVGLITAETGFSRAASALMTPTSAAVLAFVVGMAVRMWRRP